MTLEEYFAQDQYFSESQQQFVDIDSLPWLRAYYSYRKLMTAAPDDFPGTTLYEKFVSILAPKPKILAQKLEQYGEVSCAYRVFGDKVGLHEERARNRLYQAAARLGVKVKTHNTEWDSRGGNFITATVVNETSVRIKGQVVA